MAASALCPPAVVNAAAANSFRVTRSSSWLFFLLGLVFVCFLAVLKSCSLNHTLLGTGSTHVISLVPINSGSYPISPAMSLAPVVCPPHSCTVSAASLPSIARLVIFTSCPLEAQELGGPRHCPGASFRPQSLCSRCCPSVPQPHWRPASSPSLPVMAPPIRLWTRSLPGQARLGLYSTSPEAFADLPVLSRLSVRSCNAPVYR